MQRQSSSVSNSDCNVVIIDGNASEANNGAHSNTHAGVSNKLVTPTTGRRPSPVALFPVPCLNCQETNESFLSTDPTRHVVVCLKCNKEMPSSQYTPKQFVDACLHSNHL
jgi:hypothetical protein